jgi:hypothetical protein
MNIKLSNLIIETTRKCNLKCDHCLRGDSQDLDINLEHLENFLINVDYISTITFSGGEPSLNVFILENILEMLQRLNIEVNNFYMATNGYGLNDINFVTFLIKMYDYCSDNEITEVKVSNDIFHEPIDLEDTLCNALKFVHLGDRIDERYMITEGRAIDYCIGDRCLELDRHIEIDEYEDEIIIESNIYFNCKSNLITDCDYSYSTQNCEEIQICNFETTIPKDTLIKTLINL